MTKRVHTILFVDDEPGLSGEPLRPSLEARGFSCISVVNMTDAWKVLTKGGIDVVVTDIMMPAGEDFPNVDSATTGFYFVKRIRQQFARLPIICLSVINDPAKIRNLKSQGVLYLQKGETPLETARKLIESKATGKMSFG